MNFNRKTIRNTAVAGSFYPADIEQIFDFISSLESSQSEAIGQILKTTEGKSVNGLIVPHAGWIYSGKTAFLAYKILERIKPKNIALLGPSHKFPINRVLTDSHSFWSTPIGSMSILTDHFFESNDTYHAHEHALEVQIPFIKYVSGNSDILPLIVGQLTDSQVTECAKHLLDHQYFVIISTDLSHFNSLNDANRIDKRTIKNILELNKQKIDACGFHPIRIAIEYCRMINTKPHLIDYSTSAEENSNTSSVVGYASFWF